MNSVLSMISPTRTRSAQFTMAELVPEVGLPALLTAVRALLGPQAVLEHHVTSPATPNVQGFSSQMVRLRVRARPAPAEPPRELSIIAKCLPPARAETDKHRDTIRRFRREVQFFSLVEPRLRSKVSELRTVRCLVVEQDFILMEDLATQGFDTLSQGMQQVGAILLTAPHTQLALEHLARLHASSLDVDWLAELPELAEDNMFLVEDTPNSFYTMCVQAFKAAATILSEKYPDSKQSLIPFLFSPASFETLIKFAKPSSTINVLAHGDFWINNLMFKMENDSPVDIKLIDFQLLRYTHPLRDITHIFYTCLDKNFREKHEQNMLRAYIKAFNIAAGSERIDYDTMLAEFNRSRIFGCLLAVVLRTLNLMSDIYPEEGEDLTQERFEGVMCGAHYASMPVRYERDPEFREACSEVLEELILEHAKYEQT